MTMFFVDPVASAIVSIIVKTSVLLGIAAMLHGVMNRRTSAAMRHLVWTLAVLGVLLLPIASLVLPEWAVMTRTAPANVGDAAGVGDRIEEPAGIAQSFVSLAGRVESPITTAPAVKVSWSIVIAGTYAAGVLVMLIHLARQRWMVRRLAREATDVQGKEWTHALSECAASMGVRRVVRLLRSRECSMPLAFGTRRPAILIPAMADTWPEDRRRAVLLHELAHVARYDCLTQGLACAACTVYWFHPATWWIARRLRIERELACDDRVIAAGAQAREYAGHLLEIAYSLGKERAPALAVTMARPRQLEGRMLAVLDDARNRSVPAARARVAGAGIAAVLLLAIASATSKVVAVQPEANRASATAPPVLALEREEVFVTQLKAAEWPVIEPARRLVRAVAHVIGIVQNALPGTWEIRATSTEGRIQLRLVEWNSSSSSIVPIERLEGLTAAALAGTGGPVQFQLRRDAGTFVFEGVVRNGVGAGTFSFKPDSIFPSELAKRGFAVPTALEQYQLARHDIGYAFVDELKAQGYQETRTSELVRAGHHGVNVPYLRDMGALGYRLGTLAQLITLRDHGVTPDYVRELSDQGYKGLSADGLRQARDHGITPDYVRAMRDAGYGALTMDQLIKARDHGVTPEFVGGLATAGYRKLPLDQLIRVRDHGVSPEYVRDMRQLGHSVAVEELIRARDHGVDVEFVRGMASLGYAGQPLDSLIRLRDHGVTPKFVQDLKTLGYDRLSVDDLVTLRDYGLTPDRIRAANARAGTRLPIDLLKNLAAGGMK
jgi:beta-lactamase regulating signal transducer with metallopeptidase domain